MKGVDVIGKKKLNGDGIYFISNNAVDVTGSGILIKFNGKQVLLEMGLYQSNSYLDSYQVNSEKFKFEPREIDYCFIGHGHIDHVGKIGKLVKEGFKGKIIASRDTANIIQPLLLNSAYILGSQAKSLSKQFKREYPPLYEEDDVHNAMDMVYEYDDYDTIYKLDDVISFRWLRNSHCLGAKQMQLIMTGENEKTSILYTSDIGALDNKNHYVEPTEICKDFNKITIMESTYGEVKRSKRKTREFDVEHLRVAVNTVMERGGKVLLPAFSFSRTQELLTVLYELYHEDKTFNYDVVVDSKLSCEISKMYTKILSGENLKLWKAVCAWKNVKFIAEKVDSDACVRDTRPKIVISSSGFCVNGRILNYLAEYLKDTNNMIIFSGYVGDNDSYLSYRIKNTTSKTININKIPVPNRADCIALSSFSSHAGHDDLVEIGSELNTEKIILVHGSSQAKTDAQKAMQEALSKKNKTTRVICSVKDMVVHL